MNSLRLAEKYNKNNPTQKRKSKLDEHNESIQFLFENNHTLLSIQSFLENEVNFKVAYSTLRDYCDRRFNNKDELKENAKKYDEIKKHCNLIREKYFSYEEKKEINTIISLIDYFVKKSGNTNSVVKKENRTTTENSSIFAQIGSKS
jgi:hypothetical protein